MVDYGTMAHGIMHDDTKSLIQFTYPRCNIPKYLGLRLRVWLSLLALAPFRLSVEVLEDHYFMHFKRIQSHSNWCYGPAASIDGEIAQTAKFSR